LVSVDIFAMDVGELVLEEPTGPLAQAGGFFIFISIMNRQFGRVSKLQNQLDRFLRKQPKLGKGVYIARGAVVLGDVTLGSQSSVWYNAVVRGDINRIVIGHHTNVQDNAVLHLADDFPCVLGNYVTIGHSAIVHACTVGDETLVGMGAVILDGAIIGRQSIIGAKALVTQGAKIPPGSLVLGAPAKVVRALTKEERAGLKAWAEKYVENSAYCLKHGINVSEPLPT
jgi:carbonic anhydrase/acetyltransferase-like protein (isoleucine patch superfamily)